MTTLKSVASPGFVNDNSSNGSAPTFAEVDEATTLTVLGDAEEALRKLEPGSGGYVSEGGQADFHIDLDLCCLGRAADGTAQVALADVDLGLAHCDAVLARDDLFAGHFLPPGAMRRVFERKARATAERRRPYLASYRAALEALGYAVVPVPDLRLAPTENYLDRVPLTFNYVNALPGLIAGQRRVHLWHYGVPVLDEAADAAYRAAGVQPVVVSDTVTAQETFRLLGGPHCLCANFA